MKNKLSRLGALARQNARRAATLAALGMYTAASYAEAIEAPAELGDAKLSVAVIGGALVGIAAVALMWRILRRQMGG